MRSLRAALAALLLLAAVAAAPAAGGSPHYGITVADTTFPGEAAITYFTDRPRDEGSLYAQATCYDGDRVVLEDFTRLDHFDDVFRITETQVWAGGDATCEAELLYANGSFKFRILDRDTFLVTSP